MAVGAAIVAAAVIGAGSAYIAQAKFDSNKQPIADVSRLWLLPADKVRVVPHSTEFIGGYLVETEDGSHLAYKPDEIIAFKLFNPENPYYGLSEMEVGKRIIRTDFQQRAVNLEFFKNDATPGYLMGTEQPYDTSYNKVLQEEWNAAHQGAANKDKMDIVWAGLKPLPTGQRSHKDMQYNEGINLNAEEVIALMNVPPVVVGRWKDAKYANADLQKREFWEQTNVPLIMYIEAVFNELIFPRWGYDGLWMQFDLRAVQALRGDFIKEAQYHSILVDSNIEKMNEARITLGLESDPKADVYLYETQSGYIPPQSQAIKPTKYQRFNITKTDGDKAEFKKQLSFKQTHTDRLHRSLNGFFLLQNLRLIRELKTYTDEFLPENPAMLLDWYKEDVLLADTMQKQLNQSYLDSIVAGFEKINGERQFKGMQYKQEAIDELFGYADPEIVNWLETHALEQSIIIDQTTREFISRILVEAGLNNYTIDQITNTINGYFDNLPAGRAKTIALTEIGNAVNPGTFTGYQAAGATHKKWLTGHLADTRQTHLTAEGQGFIKYGEAFQVGAYKMMYPMESGAGPEEVINCHCFLQADAREEE